MMKTISLIVALILLFTTLYSGRGLNLTEKTLSSIVNGIDSLIHPFFVRIIRSRHRNHAATCGGSIIGDYWVLTAAHCIHGFTPRQIFVEVADFTEVEEQARDKTIFLAEKLFMIKTYLPSSDPIDIFPPRNDLALIKTRKALPEERIIELCRSDVPLDTLLGHCGLGLTSGLDGNSWAYSLQEAYFYEVPTDMNGLLECRPDTICTVGFNPFSTFCPGDDGGPLYEVICGTRVPKCQYGVASYTLNYTSLNPNVKFTAGSYFARVPRHLKWIRHIMRTQ